MVLLVVMLVAVFAIPIVSSAPTETEEVIKTTKFEQNEPKLDDKSYSVFDNDEFIDGKKAENQRQKRWYDNAPYNYPPPFLRPYDTGSEIENNLSYIQLRLQEILNMAKSPPPPPPPSIYPVFVPVYIPQITCGCNPTNNDQVTTKTPEQTMINPNQQNETIPDLNGRLPEIEDERQNWGIVENNTLINYDEDDDGSRPISLTPIITGNDNGILAPPVEHGSNQEDINNLESQQPSTVNSPKVDQTLQSSMQSICDKAIMSCCLGAATIKHQCIQSLGCQDPSLTKTPCNPKHLLGIIERLQSYYV